MKLNSIIIEAAGENTTQVALADLTPHYLPNR